MSYAHEISDRSLVRADAETIAAIERRGENQDLAVLVPDVRLINTQM